MQKNTYSLFLIRHGQSEQNLLDNSGNGTRPHPKGELIDESLIDASLTSLGIEQAESAKQIMKDVNVGLVIVSPLKRALQTAYEIFKDHPSKPVFKVDPDAREILAGASTVPGDLKALREEFPFDFSAFDSFKDQECWLAEAFEDGEMTKELMEYRKQVDTVQDRRLAFSRKILKKMEEISPLNPENQDVVINRGKKFGEKIKEIAVNIEQGKKIVVVAHFTLILQMYATKYDERKWATDGIRLKNCEVREYEFS